MSTLKRALERSKAAWEAVGKPERARAVLRDGPKVVREATYKRIYGMVRIGHALRTDWRAIVPKAKYEPVGTLPVVGDVVLDTKALTKAYKPPRIVTRVDSKYAYVDGGDVYGIPHFNAGRNRVLKRKVPKKAEDAGWPRYYVRDFGEWALVMRSATPCDGAYYYPDKVSSPVNGWWEPGHPERNGYNPVTPHQFAEWLYDHGHTEAAYKIQPMYETPGEPYPGDTVFDLTAKELRKVASGYGVAHSLILRRSRARRDAIAAIEGKLKALGDVK